MSLPWHAASVAAAATRRRLGRPPYAQTTAMLGRRTMASFSLSAKQGAMVRVALQCGIVILFGLVIAAGPEKRPISREAHEGEMKSIREEMKKLQDSNDEILTLLKTDRTRRE